MSIKVLLTDDHKILREGLISLLKKQRDIELIGEAEDGREAVRKTLELKPDVVIMDIGMPELNGIEATKQIKADLPEVKVIALSIHSDKRFVKGMLKAGALGYLLKDSAFKELVKAINAVHYNKMYIGSGITDIIMEDYLQQLNKDTSTPDSPLSERENEVLRLLAEGKNAKQIASLLNVSPKTIETHRQHIMEKLNIHNLADLVKYTIQAGLISLEN
ncbi:MAG: response regulator transcription factor [Bacteroidetes bacterium]|nr:response regulator transcription factor [Bacteroidota bacterium]